MEFVSIRWSVLSALLYSRLLNSYCIDFFMS